MKTLPGYAAALLALAVSAARPASAQPAAEAAPARVHLSSSYGPGAQRCASATELRAAVEARLGRSVFVPVEEADLIAQVRASKRGREYVVDVLLFDRNQRRRGERRLTTRARHCSALDDSLALVLALAADVTRESLGAPAAPAAPPQPPVPLSTPLELPATTPAPREEIRIRPGLGVSAGAELLPSVSAGVHAALELAFPRFWPFWLRAALWHDQRLGDRRGVELTLQTLELGVCPVSIELDALELSLCAQQLLARSTTKGFGFDFDDRNNHWNVAFGAGAQLRYFIGASFVSVQGSLLVPAVQRRYFFEEGEEETLYEESWLRGLGSVTAGFEL